MNEAIVEVKGHKYSIGKMPLLAQFHVGRRLGPLLITMGISVSDLREGASKLNAADLAPMMVPIMEIMARMSDEDSNYIITTSLQVVKRDAGGGKFAPAFTPDGTPAYMDIDLPVMMRLVMDALKENLGNFLEEQSEEPSSQGS